MPLDDARAMAGLPDGEFDAAYDAAMEAAVAALNDPEFPRRKLSPPRTTRS